MHTSAAHSVVFRYTAPIFAALGLKAIPKERLTRLQWSGIGISWTVVPLTFHTFIIAIASYLIWFWLLRQYLTSRLLPMSLLTPLFGVLFGRVFLGDAFEPRFAVGAVCVLAGVLIVNLQAAPAVR